ncbi:response regulator [Symmachiella dynata]|uniref:Response regulator rcp1 n=1 Tax=Symmachiella dynata TaxID=2527995 RepID=A0A517ZUR2_9PLAN|nr:response regulator [Symmachiella dynata]QDT50559.1 Response regulator rcp1 [Symmachiella dynata]QDU46217.1 Response regulator rcp1 [Symmachiella dynata]
MQLERTRILLVEDDMDHAKLIKECFEDQRLTSHITHLPDGQAALDYLLHQGEYSENDPNSNPDLILLDLRLRRVDGLKVLRTIKTTEGIKRIPVIILTTSSADRDLCEAYDLHANSYLVKPIGFDDFCRLIQDLETYWTNWNRQPTYVTQGARSGDEQNTSVAR